MKVLIVREKSNLATCKRCGHKCHCYEIDCKECVNDVCFQCDCEDSRYQSLRKEVKGTRREKAFVQRENGLLEKIS